MPISKGFHIYAFWHPNTQCATSTTFLNFFGLFTTASMACGGSQARGQIRATAASLYHSRSNAKSFTFN